MHATIGPTKIMLATTHIHIHIHIQKPFSFVEAQCCQFCDVLGNRFFGISAILVPRIESAMVALITKLWSYTLSPKKSDFSSLCLLRFQFGAGNFQF